MIALKKNPKATKCSDQHTISLTVHTTNIVARMLKEGLKGTFRIYLENVSLDVEEEKGLGMQLGCCE
jgi:hypothetical protein